MSVFVHNVAFVCGLVKFAAYQFSGAVVLNPLASLLSGIQ